MKIIEEFSFATKKIFPETTVCLKKVARNKEAKKKSSTYNKSHFGYQVLSNIKA